ncbi:MAG: helix-turn-helix domain-containing protein [Erythrobacter sp.]|uniref:helix-turn-helix domain-containing protein n=1 Tax=Erythrobacter sp. TaxID=1042 RepID=UPI003298239E
MHTESGSSVSIRFALPSAKLSPFITTYYCTKVAASNGQAKIEDRLHPEWANLRFMDEDMSQSAMGSAPFEAVPRFAVAGPTATALRFRMKPGRSWGIGLMPLGWAALFDAPASDYSDRVVDGNQDSVFRAFHPLARILSNSNRDFAEELALIEAHMEGLILRDTDEMHAIEQLNAALVDPKIATVTELAEEVAMNVRSLERLSKRAFGFSPKLLLRRQRFLRSLSKFMLDPSMKWLNTLDQQYHDQAHFVRDFKQFMGMIPSVYAKLDKPILMAAAQARMAIAGQAVQALHGANAD